MPLDDQKHFRSFTIIHVFYICNKLMTRGNIRGKSTVWLRVNYDAFRVFPSIFIHEPKWRTSSTSLPFFHFEWKADGRQMRACKCN